MSINIIEKIPFTYVYEYVSQKSAVWPSDLSLQHWVLKVVGWRVSIEGRWLAREYWRSLVGAPDRPHQIINTGHISWISASKGCRTRMVAWSVICVV